MSIKKRILIFLMGIVAVFAQSFVVYADEQELPGLTEIVEANNFIQYCEQYDNMYMNYESDINPCEAYYTKIDGKSFYIKYMKDSSYEVVKENYAISYDADLGEAEYYLFLKTSDELAYRISVAPEPRMRAMLGSYISKVGIDEYDQFFDDENNYEIGYDSGHYIWTIDYSNIDWIEGKDVYHLDPNTLICQELTYYDGNGNVINRWTAKFNIEENPVPDTLTYKEYTEPQKTTTVEVYDVNGDEKPLKTWEVASNSNVYVYGETVYENVDLSTKFNGKVGDDSVLKLYIQKSEIKSGNHNIFGILAGLFVILLVVAYGIEKISLISIGRKND